MHKLYERQIAALPQTLLRNILKRKLEAGGSKIPPEAVDALVSHILSGNTGSFIWDDGRPTTENIDLRLSFDEADFKEIDEIIERLPDIIKDSLQDAIRDGAKVLYKQLFEDWNSYREYEDIEAAGFKYNLMERWGAGIQILRMLLVAVREIGERNVKRHRRSKSKSKARRRFVLARLHIRACQVADEIITLLENGFADGAMARWRTLHEIDIVATIIEDGDEDLAQRYIDHEIVDQKKQIDDWDDKMAPLGYEPIDSQTRQDIERKYENALAIYGSEFKNEYGWASTKLGIKRPDFRALQHAANQSSMNIYYKLANYNVHAGSRSMFTRLTDLGSNIAIAGRSNAGLLEPGQNTAFTLTRITGTVVGRVRDLDRLIEMRVLTLMRDAAQKAFQRADRKLSRDDAAFRRQERKRRHARLKTTQSRTVKK